MEVAHKVPETQMEHLTQSSGLYETEVELEPRP